MARRTATIDRPPVSEAPATDRELLRHFADTRDEAAFNLLFRRHGGMVLATARRVLGNAHDAEDVCQAAFVLLAKKAGTLRWRESVGPWLHRTAHLMALKARTAAARRARREGRAAARGAHNPLAEMSGQELLAVLDAEVLALPDALRAPVVLCYLEGATRDEAAQRLGCPLGTLKNRLERGRDRLHAALVRRGLGLSTILLGTLLTRPNATASDDLARRTAESAVAAVAGRPVPPAVGRLVEAGLTMTTRTKVKALLAVLLVGGLVASAGALGGRAGEEKPTPPPPKEAAKADPQPDAPATTRAVRIIVLDPDGKPLPGANVHVGIWTYEKGFKANRDVETDAAGAARVELPKTYFLVRLWASKEGLVTLWAGWEQEELAGGREVPAEYTFRLEKAATAGGRVVDEAGKPVASARVQVDLAGDTKPAHADGRARIQSTLAFGDSAATTDADGRWRITNAPDRSDLELRLIVTHPDFVTDRSVRSTKAAGITSQMLRDGTAKVPLRRGVVIRGRVTDPDGHAVKDALVIHGDGGFALHEQVKFPTDADGRYRMPALERGTRTITVVARGWAPQLRKVDLKDGLPEQDFRLAPGKPARLKVVDAAGKPVPNASVTPMEWKGSRSIDPDTDPNHPKVPDPGIPRRANAAGVWEWTSAPDDPVKVRVGARGFGALETEVTGGTPEKTVTLKAEHRVTGTVTDAVTGKPIPVFTIIPVDVFRKDFLHAERFNGRAGKDGQLGFLVERADIPQRLRIEAPGYRTQDGPEFRLGDDAARIQNFRLRTSPPRTGIVVDASGKPASGVDVVLATPTAPADLATNHGNHAVKTDAAGRFEFPDPGETWTAVARSDAGVAFANASADKADIGILTIRPWASVSGRFVDGGRPVRGATVLVRPIRLEGLSEPRVQAMLQVETDADGRFAFSKIPPGPVSVWVHLGPWSDPGFRSGPQVPLDLKPGEKAAIDFGSGGATITGKVKLTGKVPIDLDYTYSLNYLVRREPGVAPPPEIAGLGFDARKGWSDSWTAGQEGRTFLSTLHHWFVKLAADGSFRISGVPAGEYDLAVSVYAKPSGCLVDPLARKVVRITVTESVAAHGEITIADVPAEVVPIPAVGDTPALAFQRADGTDGTLADVKGKYAVIHFWASWCGPCKQQLPALRKVQERFAARGLAVLSLSLDDDPAAWRAAFKSADLSWAQGRLTGGAPGVSSVPTYYLIDPAGKLVAKVYDPDELAQALADRLP